MTIRVAVLLCLAGAAAAQVHVPAGPAAAAPAGAASVASASSSAATSAGSTSAPTLFGLAWGAPRQVARAAGQRGYVAPDGTRPNAAFIDNDGDGYGPGCPKGPDADDEDPQVNTTATVLAKHKTVAAFIGHKGYAPRRIFYIDPKGNNKNAAINDESRPFGNFDYVIRMLRRGDMVLFRAGRYDNDDIRIQDTPLVGTPNDLFYLMAYPGEQVIIDIPGDCLRIARSAYIVADGFVFDNTRNTLGHGVSINSSHHLVLRNIEARRHIRGIIGMQDLHDVLIESCLLHDNDGEHGIYLGSRDLPNSNLVIRDCVIHHNAGNGIQHNGRVSGLRIENNLIHTNGLAGVSLMQGVCDSLVANNLIFNNNKQGVLITWYDSSDADIRSYDQCRNAVAGNTIWIGRNSWNGGYQTKDFAAVLFNDGTEKKSARMEGNAVSDNILATHNGPALFFSLEKFLGATKVDNNLVFRAAGPSGVLRCQDASTGIDDLLKRCGSTNQYGDPGFPDVSVDYYKTPEKFAFVKPRR
jgi:hypothetical protein